MIKYNIFVYIVFACAQAFLVANRSFESVFLMSTLMISLYFLIPNRGKGILNFKLHMLVILLQVLCGFNFYWNWIGSNKARIIAELLQIQPAVLVIVTTIIVAFLGYWFQINLVKNSLLSVKSEVASKYQDSSSFDFQTWKHRLVFCFFFAFFSLTFFL